MEVLRGFAAKRLDYYHQQLMNGISFELLLSEAKESSEIVLFKDVIERSHPKFIVYLDKYLLL